MKAVMMIFFYLLTIFIFPSVIASPQPLQDDDYDKRMEEYDSNEETDSEEYDEESSWTQPLDSKAQFHDKNQTVEVAEGSIARLHCRVDNRDQGEQIMWYSLYHVVSDSKEKQKEDLLTICSVNKDVHEGERKEICISYSTKDARNRFRDEGQLLTISNVTKADNGKVYKCSLAVGEPMPSIYLTLVVHPSDWEAPKTTPSQQARSVDDIQNLPSTGTSQDNSENSAACIETSFLYTFLLFGLLAHHLHFILPR